METARTNNLTCPECKKLINEGEEISWWKDEEDPFAKPVATHLYCLDDDSYRCEMEEEALHSAFSL